MASRLSELIMVVELFTAMDFVMVAKLGTDELGQTCLTCEIEKPNGDREVLDTKRVPAKGTPMVNLVSEIGRDLKECVRTCKRYRDREDWAW